MGVWILQTGRAGPKLNRENAKVSEMETRGTSADERRNYVTCEEARRRICFYFTQSYMPYRKSRFFAFAPKKRPLFRDKGVPKQRGWFLSNVTAATPRSLAPKKLPSFGTRVSRNTGGWFLSNVTATAPRSLAPKKPPIPAASGQSPAKHSLPGGGSLGNYRVPVPRSGAPKKLPSFGNKIPETPGVGFLQMFRDFGLARLVGPDHPKSRNIRGVGFFPM